MSQTQTLTIFVWDFHIHEIQYNSETAQELCAKRNICI